MGQLLRLHADSRDGQGQGRAGARRRRHNGSRACTSQSGTPRAKHEGSEYKAQPGAYLTFGEVGRAVDRAGPQASAIDYVLGGRQATSRHLDSDLRTAQSGRMIATPASSPSAAIPAGHPLLQALISRPFRAVMGVLNVTPDSFSDGGQFAKPEHA